MSNGTSLLIPKGILGHFYAGDRSLITKHKFPSLLVKASLGVKLDRRNEQGREALAQYIVRKTFSLEFRSSGDTSLEFRGHLT